jgi:hypothetical protein
MVQGRSLGLNEVGVFALSHKVALTLDTDQAVLPPLPICTGVVTATSILSALRDRATKGGSYHVVGALTAFDMFNVSEVVGQYPTEIVKKVGCASSGHLRYRC